MKNIILILALISSIYAQNIDLNLKQFAELVSSQHLVNIIIDDSIEEEKFTFYVQKNKNKILLGAFKRMLELKKLRLIYDNKYKFYYIKPILKRKVKEKKKEEEKNNLYTIRLYTLLYSDIELMLAQLKNVKHSYIKNTNSIMIYTTETKFKEIEKVIKENDVILEQFQLKITVVETNIDEVEEQGLKISAYSQSLSGSEQYFLNLITMPSTAVTNVLDTATNAFTASLSFLKSEDISNIVSSPYVTVQSGKKVYFSSVENVPYQISTSQINGASQSAQTSVEYKDVGLKVDLTPMVVEDIVYIDLDFTIEALIGERTSTPTTSKRNLKSSFQLKKNQLLVLSGLENTTVSSTTIGIPILMEMPYLGDMFCFDIQAETKKSLSIMIEIL